MAQRLCVVGGSGFVGRAIVQEAVRQGYQVTVACRHPERSRELLNIGVRLVRADIVDGRGLDEAVREADVVINLVGLLFEKGRYTFRAAHVDGTAHVLAACRQAGVRQYLQMSALGAGEVPASKYSSTKGEAENEVRQSGLNWTIFRPSIIYGAGDSFFNKFKAMSATLPVFPVIAGETRFQPVWVEDVARAFVMAIGNRHVSGQTYELGGPVQYSFRALIELLMGELGRKRWLVPMPMFAARMLAMFGQFLPTPPLTPDQLVLLQHDNVVKGDHFPALFGRAAALEDVLPTYIHGSQVELMQQSLDGARRHYRKGGL